MSWGTELWDQWDNVSSHTQKGIAFLENYAHFIRDRSNVELEYARNLRRLVKTYLPKKKDEETQFSYIRMFREALNETGDLAGQHEVIAENLTKDLLQELNNLIRETKDERKKLLSEGNKVQQQLQQSLQSLEKSKKNYEKSFKEAEKAQENYQKADADLHLSRAEVEKQKLNASIKNHHCEDYKNEYANQLQKTNQFQSAHYSTVMPGIFNSLQQLDQKRITHFKNCLVKSVDVERSVFPIINKCLDGVVQASENIDETCDSQIVIEKYKSGFLVPGDIGFEDLSAPKQNGDSTPVHHPPTRQDTIKGTLSTTKLKKRVGLLGIFGSNKDDYNDLPPNQRKKKIQQKMSELSSKLQQETAAREGLLKMKGVYSENPHLGDPATITGQLSDANQSIDKLRVEIERYQTMLEEAEMDPQISGGTASGGPNTPNSAALGRHASSAAGVGVQINGGGASPRSSLTSHRTSLSDESLSRSASDSSVCTHSPPMSLLSAVSSSPASSTTTPSINNHHSLASRISQTLFNSPASTSSSQIPRLSSSTPSNVHHTPLSSTSTVTSNSNKKLRPSAGSSHSPESGIGLSHNSLHGSDTYDQIDTVEEHEEFEEAEPLPTIGVCQALYQFDATSEGSMPMAEGEKLHLIEVDQGDGWTRVRRMEVFEEGFVPTTYIQITLDNNC